MMEFEADVMCFGIKESSGTFEGREFSSTTFHLETNLAENASGRSMGIVTRPFKYGNASEFNKWEHLAKTPFPIKVKARFTIQAGADNSTSLKLVDIKPISQQKPAA